MTGHQRSKRPRWLGWRLFRWLGWFRRGEAQLILALLAALLVAQALTLQVLFSERDEARQRLGLVHIAAQIGATVQLLDAAPRGQRDFLVQAMRTPQIEYAITARPRVASTDADRRSGWLRNRLRAGLRRGPAAVQVAISKRPPWRQDEEWARPDQHDRDDGWHDRGKPDAPTARDRRPVTGLLASVRLRGGAWLNAHARTDPLVFELARGPLMALLIGAPLAVLAALMLMRRVMRPIRAMAAAADAVGRGDHPPPVPETGPADMRASVRAFNQMRERVDRFIADRTRLLAAMSHDLRTPITSLRIRTEFIDDEELRGQMIATLDEMAAMVEAALTFARDDARRERAERVTLAPLVSALVAELQLLPRPVTLTASTETTVLARPMALKRAIRNIMENAVRYGERARVAVLVTERGAVVRIDDNGPGIPEADRERVFDPYVRLEGSRSTETGGIGLGLSIARSIIRAHGGEITLLNRAEGGLQVEIRLPVA